MLAIETLSFSVQGSPHLFYLIVEKKFIRNYFQGIRDGEGRGAPLTVINDLGNLIEIYERIRNLDQFDPNHCPIMEFQTRIVRDKVENYFLQCHRTRDFEASTFGLNGLPELGFIHSNYVRGATSPRGKICKVLVACAAEHRPRSGLDGLMASLSGKWKWRVDDAEEGAMEEPRNRLINEIMSRRRYLQIISCGNNYERFTDIATRHKSRSLWFKPQVSIFLSYEDCKRIISPEELYGRAWEKARKTGKNQYVNLKVISDGRKAFIKRVDLFSETPWNS